MKRTINFETALTIEEVAEAFCEMNSAEQAAFFNTVYAIASDWASPFSYQMDSVASESVLDEGGRSIMRQIGEYSGVQ